MTLTAPLTRVAVLAVALLSLTAAALTVRADTRTDRAERRIAELTVEVDALGELVTEQTELLLEVTEP